MENNSNTEFKDMALKARLVINSNRIKDSKFELVWRIGITVAVAASIIMQIL